MKVLGYILAVIGLAIIALSSKISKLSFLSGMSKALAYTILAGAIVIVIGIALVLTDSPSKSNKVKLAEEEVPIYEGEGKKRRIVGYRKEEK